MGTSLGACMALRQLIQRCRDEIIDLTNRSIRDVAVNGRGRARAKQWSSFWNKRVGCVVPKGQAPVRREGAGPWEERLAVELVPLWSPDAHARALVLPPWQRHGGARASALNTMEHRLRSSGGVQHVLCVGKVVWCQWCRGESPLGFGPATHCVCACLRMRLFGHCV